jgi:hypothetical protein
MAVLTLNLQLASKVVRIPIQVLESYDFRTLQHHVDPNPTLNPNLIKFMLSPDPNHRILHNIAKSRSCLWTLPILNELSHPLNFSSILCQPPKPFSLALQPFIYLPIPKWLTNRIFHLPWRKPYNIKAMYSSYKLSIHRCKAYCKKVLRQDVIDQFLK